MAQSLRSHPCPSTLIANVTLSWCCCRPLERDNYVAAFAHDAGFCICCIMQSACVQMAAAGRTLQVGQMICKPANGQQKLVC